jgi:RimJ/RimL family protein N-acetyltransferase
VVEPPETPVTIAVGRWLLDVARDSDVDAIAEALSDPDIATWNPSSQVAETQRERAQLWIADRAAWAADHASWVVRSPEGRAVGAVSLHHLDHGMLTAEIGYWLVPQARGLGVGAAAVDAATRYAFDDLGMLRVELFHAVENTSSCRLAERCGYLLEGTSRQSFVYGDGLRHDEHLHARLAADAWPPVAPPA